MNWACFLHIYQPPEQYVDIVDSVAKQSYRPVLRAIREGRGKVTLNVNGALLELFDKYGFHDIIDELKDLGKLGKIEFTGSAKYHPFLPLIPDGEVTRQIKINNETNRFFLGEAYKPRGFFPPEMAVTQKLVPIIEECGFEWIIADEIAHSGGVGTVDYSKTYKIKDSRMYAFFRERRLSNLIMGAAVRSKESLVQSMRRELPSSSYVLTAMDGETFGHHRPGLEKLLFEILSASEFNMIGVSDILNLYAPFDEAVTLIDSTWATSPKDIEEGAQFLTWNDPENGIHKIYWQFLNFVLGLVGGLSDNKEYHTVVRAKMDMALSSDPLFWASAKPWWSLEMIEDGVYKLLDVVKSIPDIDPEIEKQARGFFETLVITSLKWERSGKVRRIAQEKNQLLRIPFKERTLEKEGSENVYHAFIDMMRGLEKKAAAEGEYEKAILWRDAVYKIENKSDIYDAVNAIDLVRIELTNQEVEEIIKKYEGVYKKIRGGQPEQRGA